MRLVAEAEWPHGLADLPAGERPRYVWKSSRYLASLWLEDHRPPRLSVRHIADPCDESISWEELQRIKRECGFGDQAMVEIYPPESDVVNVANMRHLWLADIPWRWKA